MRLFILLCFVVTIWACITLDGFKTKTKATGGNTEEDTDDSGQNDDPGAYEFEVEETNDESSEGHVKVPESKKSPPKEEEEHHEVTRF
nr:hypothetical transcript [Hymenolepis microstoma]